MKVLVTGATGFIGRYVVAELLKRPGIEIVATSFSDDTAGLPTSPRLRYVKKDLTEREADFHAFFGHPDVMVHLAWSGLPNYNELFHIEDNFSSQYAFIKNMVEHGLERIAITGTCFEYGLQEGCLHEDLPTAPVNNYALAKDTLRKHVEALRKKFDFELAWLRLFYPYGDGQARTSVLEQLKGAIERGESVFNMSKGDQLRDFVPVEEMARQIVAISLRVGFSGIVNCCSGKPTSVRALVEGYLQETGRQIELNLGHYPYPAHEPMAFWGDSQRLQELLGDSKE